MEETASRRAVPPRKLNTKYPLIDCDPHFRRVIRYARRRDWTEAAIFSVCPPALLVVMEKVSPSHVGRGGFAPILRLTWIIGILGGFFHMYDKSSYRFYGATENKREIEMDMREMVDKVKRGEPPYGESTLTEHMQGVASRNSRYSSVFHHLVPWFNFVNHPHHGVDTAKYYQQAERELEAERLAKKQ